MKTKTAIFLALLFLSTESVFARGPSSCPAGKVLVTTGTGQGGRRITRCEDIRVDVYENGMAHLNGSQTPMTQAELEDMKANNAAPAEFDIDAAIAVASMASPSNTGATTADPPATAPVGGTVVDGTAENGAIPTTPVQSAEQVCTGTGQEEFNGCRQGERLSFSTGANSVTCTCTNNQFNSVSREAVYVLNNENKYVKSQSNDGGALSSEQRTAAGVEPVQGSEEARQAQELATAQAAEAQAAQTELLKNMDAFEKALDTKLGSALGAEGKASEINLQSTNQIFADEDSSFLGKCELLLKQGTKWSAVVAKSNEQEISNMFRFSYKQIFDDLKKDLRDKKDSLNNTEIGIAIRNSLIDAHDRVDLVQRCTALAFMTTKVDYSSPKTTSVEGIDSIKRSFDQKIIARKNGVETQDYPACSRAIDKYNAAFLGGQALQIGQTFQFQEASMDASIKAQENANDITAGMVAQKEMTDEQKKIANTKAAFSGAKGAAMAFALSEIPTRKSLIKECNAAMTAGGSHATAAYDLYVEAVRASITDAGLNNRVELVTVSGFDRIKKEVSAAAASGNFYHNSSAPTTAATSGGTPAPQVEEPIFPINYASLKTETAKYKTNNICSKAAGEDVSLTMNEVSCREKIKKAMIEAGVETASNLLKAKLLDDQSDMIGDAINNVKKFDEDNPAPTFEEFNAEIVRPTLLSLNVLMPDRCLSVGENLMEMELT